jgi:hypothetical protein
MAGHTPASASVEASDRPLICSVRRILTPMPLGR